MVVKEKSAKCVVWDLDNTIWSGVLLEDPAVVPRPDVLDAIRTLDRRGILQSIASKNDFSAAMQKLREYKLDEYFLCPQIGWGSKVGGLERIARDLNINLDTIVLVDDQQAERDEVRFSLPQVRCFDAADIATLLSSPSLNPRIVTDDARNRRRLYLLDIRRQREEEEFVGPKEEFLATLRMKFTVGPVAPGDLERAEELTRRTNQLNTTGYTYSAEELQRFAESGSHLLLIASLEDKYGPYGKIGLTLAECGDPAWTIKLLLMSCRVMSRGVGNILLGHIMRLARESGHRLRAEFVPNNVNRMMYVTYKFAGFREVEKVGEVHILEHSLDQILPIPPYVEANFLPFLPQQHGGT